MNDRSLLYLICNVIFHPFSLAKWDGKYIKKLLRIRELYIKGNKLGKMS
jgi:hypothetical protein